MEKNGGSRLDLVVVPSSPGPVVRLEPGRPGQDALDDLIDEILPDVDGGPGWFDAGLLVVGAGLVALALVTGGPTFVLVPGLAALALGCVLPVRTGWRRVQARRLGRRQSTILATGVPLDVSSPTIRRLVAAYEAVLGLGGAGNEGAAAMAAAHGALLEAASLLQGRAPAPGREREYVDRRRVAIEDLAAALALPPVDVDAAARVEARAEVEELAGFTAVSRLEELTEETRSRRHGCA